MAEITPTQRRFLAALLVSRTVSEAIRRANVSERSAWRWMKDEAFRAALEEAEGQTLEDVMRRLIGMQEQALNALQAILGDPQARHGDKLRAIDMALSHFLRLREAITLEERLNELERRIEEVRNEQHGRPVEAD
jgi:hypothetical protein